MVSDLAVAQSGQVITDSRIMVFPTAAVPVPMTMKSNASIPLPCVKPLAVEAETGHAETKDQGRDQDVIRLAQPGGQAHRSKYDREDRRKATDRRYRRADNARRDEGAVVHNRSSVRVGDAGRKT